MSGGFPLPDTRWPPLASFWEGAAQGELRLPRCADCGAFRWYPVDDCRACGGTELRWVRLSGRGSLYSWAVVRRALEPSLAVLQPYVSALVAIEEDPVVRIVTRIVDIDPAELRGDMAVEVRFLDLGYPVLQTGQVGPLFVPRCGT